MDMANDSTLRFYGGVKNVFNDKGPFVPHTGDQYESGIGNFDHLQKVQMYELTDMASCNQFHE